MPLHAEREAPGPAHGDRLDRAVLGDGLDREAVGEPVDALAVQRVDLDPLGAVEQRLQDAARRQSDGMGEAVALLERLGLVRAVVEPARELMDMLVQRAAQGDVELLQPAADAQDRHGPGERADDQGQGGGVARRVGLVALARRRAAIEARVDVGRAARDHQAVEPAEQLVGIEPGAQGRDQDRDRRGAGDDGVDILVADAVEMDLVAALQAGGHPDEGGGVIVAHGRHAIARAPIRGQAGAGHLKTRRGGSRPLPPVACGADSLPGRRRGLSGQAALLSITRGCAGCTADLDLARLHRLGHLALQLDVEQAVRELGTDDLDVVGELEAMLEGALRDAAMQVLDAVLGLADLALHRQHVLVRGDVQVALTEASDRHRDAVLVLADLGDVVRGIGDVATGLTQGGLEQLVEMVEPDGRPEQGGKIQTTHHKSSS